MNIRVVVADDSPLVREGVTRALNEDPGLDVVGQASTGREAVALAEELHPDVMILDLRMPDLGGLAVLDKLRNSQPQIRVIVMTASEQASTLLDAIAAGAAGYLSKRTPGEELRPAQGVLELRARRAVLRPSAAGPRARRPAPRRAGQDRQRDRQGAVHLGPHGAEPPHADPREDRPAPPRRAHALGPSSTPSADTEALLRH